MSEDEQTAGQSLDELLVTLEDTPGHAAWRKRARGSLAPKKHIDRSSSLTEDQKLELEILRKKRRSNSAQKSKAKKKAREKEKVPEEEPEEEPEVLFTVLDIRGPKNEKLLEFWKRKELRAEDEEGETRRTVRDMRPPADPEDAAEDGPGDNVQTPPGRGSAIDYLPPDDWTAE